MDSCMDFCGAGKPVIVEFMFAGVADTRLMGMSCFLVQKCMRIIPQSKVSCFSIHFFADSLRKSHVLHVFFAYFAYMRVILCLCGAVCGRQFVSRVDV